MKAYQKYASWCQLVGLMAMGLSAISLASCDRSSGDVNLPEVTIADASVGEGDAATTTMTFNLSLSAASTSVVSVDYQTSDGLATSGIDFQNASGVLQFAAGEIQKSINVIVIADTDDEANETFSMSLSSAINATIGRGTAIGTIVDDDGSVVYGLDSRPDNLSCIAPARPDLDSSVAVIDPFPNLPNISLPTKMLLEPVANPRWFVLRKSGQLMTFDPDVATSTSTFLDLSGRVRTNSEGGLLGMAFHPNYPQTPEIFLSYTINHNNPSMRSVFSRFILDDITNPGAGTVEQVLLQVDQDFDNHNGGDIAFGPDGYLYIGLGDGGSGGDPRNRAQNTTHLLGSMLRIDVRDSAVSFPSTPYVIPTDNPFAGNASCGPGLNASNCPEIYAWGLRNPWRWSFDSATGDLWLADVGQGDWEEIDLIERGGNYGWRCREGANDYNLSGCSASYIDPVSEYPRSLGNSITGGTVYRGSAMPELAGRYVFADYGSGRIWALLPDGQGGYLNDQLIDTNFGPTSFAEDQNGELYFTDINNSRLRMLVPPSGTPSPDTIPDRLSDSGCTDPTDITQPYSGLLPYDINAVFWSDNAHKERYFGIPNGEAITRNGDDDWEFPPGTVIVKNFRLNGDLVETRHLMRHPDGIWAGYTYEWNAQQTEATRVKGGKTISVEGQDWIFPEESQCIACHTSAAGFTLGLQTAQLNKVFTYPSTMRVANQLETLDHLLLFAAPLSAPVQNLPRLASPLDTAADLNDRARAYLHTNCAQCHRPNGPTPSDMDLQYTTSLTSTNACDALPMEGNLGITSARLIAPGDAARSLLVVRASRRDSHGMPPLGSALVDSSGIDLLTNWINGLPGCNP